MTEETPMRDTPRPAKRVKVKPPRAPTAPFRLRMAARTIARWTPPKPEEPAHGYMLRLAALHRHSTVPAFAAALGVDRLSDVETCADVLAMSRFAKPEQLASLRTWTPRFHGGEPLQKRRMKIKTNYTFADMAGETVRCDDLKMTTRRFCSGCLAEDAYHRSWFDLAFMKTCPIHGLPMTDKAPDGTTVGFHRSTVASSAGGVALSKPSPRLANVPDTIEAYVLGRMGVVDKTENALLDPYFLYEVLQAAEFVGRLKIFGFQENMPLAGRSGRTFEDLWAAGYSVLKGGLPAVEELLRGIAACAPPTCFGTRNIFGWAYVGFTTGENLALRIRRSMSEIAADLGKKGRGKEQPLVPENLTPQEIAQIVGCSPDTAANLAKTLDLFLPHAKRHGIPRLVAKDSVDLIRDAFVNGLSRQQAAVRLGVDLDTFKKLAYAGYIEDIGCRWGEGPGAEDRFRVAAVDAFMERIPIRTDATLKPGSAPGMAHLMRITDFLDVTDWEPADFITDVIDGKLVLAGRVIPTKGLGDFYIDPTDIPIEHPLWRRCRSTVTSRASLKTDAMTQLEACAVLEIEPSTAKALTDLGFLEILPGKDSASRSKLDPASISAFARRYAAGKLYAKALGCHPTQVARKMAARGVLDIVSATGTTSYNQWKLSPFFERSIMREVLKLVKDPDDDDVVRQFWKEVGSTLARYKSIFMLRQIYPDGSAMFSDSKRDWTIYLERIYEKPTYPTHPVAEVHYPSNYAYTIKATYRMPGGKDHWRAAELHRSTSSRALSAPIIFDYDEFNGLFEAILYTHFVRPAVPSLQPAQPLTDDRDRIGKVIMEILELLRGVLVDGSKRFDERTFGLWRQWREA